ncbi:sigma-70 family RNA polymerase sigma factor [Mucilaginibacter sp. UR6-1]|uniref:RNA polymerase sigma factor n=1 Tax=Mucilaginibacter sp. UR6-1 TaxID=1435643 RepID=UPI001E524817|nr:sigma-70 family RNA polymerase sigma factor [Mucilaginibacter sp. UR6-1]MCC8407821.1 sigma-70 family RNA polymerase sigma factor [Mucilaginibacter sp. UR6-1]
MTDLQIKTAHFNQLYSTTQPKLYAMVINVCRDKDMALDILQKVYLKLWEKWDTIEPKENLMPLLFTFAKNKYIDELRKNKCARAATASITPDKEDALCPATDAQFNRKEYREVLATVISRLTSRRREVVKLYLEEDLSRKKLAERLKISPNTVDNHLQESLNFIRHELSLYIKAGID